MWQVCKLYLGVFTDLEDHIPGGDMSVLLSPTQQAYTSCICRPRTVVTVFRRSPLTASLYLVKSEAFIWVLEINILWLWVPFLPLLGGQGIPASIGLCMKRCLDYCGSQRRRSAGYVCLLASLWNQCLGGNTAIYTVKAQFCLPESSWHRCTEFNHITCLWRVKTLAFRPWLLSYQVSSGYFRTRI